MPRIAEFIDPTPDPVWRPAQQCGVTAAFGCIRVHKEAGR